ncbi:type II CAAX endopeptidase family protein [Luedemannella flava]|uniref:Type II CAAX endopeptidase family protein n=1 Tax=Luedemannella flava TaxID=349316 RepID=A0ABP4XKQ0_9ACTN
MVDQVRSPLSDVVLRREVLLLLGVSLGQSALYSIVSFVGKLTAPAPLSTQTTTLNPSQAPGRPWLDLSYQLLGVLFNVVPALLAIHLLRRDHADVPSSLGLDRRRPAFDLLTGVGITAAIGIPGIGLYVLAKELGINTAVAAANLPDIWWAVPVLILAAIGNAVIEEVVVVGYLLTRLGDLRWGRWPAIVASALLRGSYHLYQGVGGFVGNIVMGLAFGWFFTRTRRLWPLIVAHTLLDVIAYLGYTYLADKVGFLK